MPSIKTKYGTVINTSGLSPEQIAKVRNIAEANGAYGAKGAALANTLRKRMQIKGATPVDAGGGDMTTQIEPNGGVDPASGAINPEDLFASAKANWNDERAKGLRDQAQSAAYDFTTKNYASDKAAEMEAAKQEAAQRGIPYDPGNPDSAYSRSVGAVDRKYQDLDTQAKNLALSQGNEIYQTEVGANNSSFDSFIQAALGMSQADLNKYGIDQNQILQLKQIAAQKQIAALNRRASGGGGGSAEQTGDLISNAGFGV